MDTTINIPKDILNIELYKNNVLSKSKAEARRGGGGGGGEAEAEAEARRRRLAAAAPARAGGRRPVSVEKSGKKVNCEESIKI